MTIKEIKNRLGEIAKLAANASGTELDKLTQEAKDLNAKLTEAQNRQKLKDMAAGAAASGEPKPAGEAGEDPKNAAAERGKQLRAGNSVKFKFEPENSLSLSSSQTVMKEHTANGVHETFNEVSSLIDRVTIVPLDGGESYERGFVKGYGEGGYTTEGSNYTEAEPTFGYAEITKAKITAYCEEPEEIGKLADSAYSDIIGDSVRVAIRKKITKQILLGNGAANNLKGIFHVPTSASNDIIDRNTDIAISEVDENTLDEIIYAFGGDEDVEDVAVLILNKLDLKAFATCRLTDGRKAYDVVNNGNTGTINGVPYIINSACAAVSASGTTTGAYCMAYGPLSSYELAIFSDMDVKHSTDFKFKTGQIAHRGSIFVGGNVTRYNGFQRVKKAASN